MKYWRWYMNYTPSLPLFPPSPSLSPPSVPLSPSLSPPPSLPLLPPSWPHQTVEWVLVLTPTTSTASSPTSSSETKSICTGLIRYLDHLSSLLPQFIIFPSLQHYTAIKKYISNGPLLVDVSMSSPNKMVRSFMDSLLAFWPGLQVWKHDFIVMIVVTVWNMKYSSIAV